MLDLMSVDPPGRMDPTALGRRLQSRLEEKGWAYQDFQRRVRDASGGARGTSYGSIWAYANGQVAEPRPRIVAVMADVLGLSREWLATGTGPRTREEAARRELAAGPDPDPGDDRMRGLVRAMARARRRLPSPESELLGRRDHLLETLVVDLMESGGRGLESYGEGEVAEAVTLVAWLLALPLRMLDPGDPRRRVRDRDPYVLAMAAAIRASLPPPPEGRPFNVLSRLRLLRSALGEAARGNPGSAPDGGPSAPH